MSAKASQITGSTVCSTAISGLQKDKTVKLNIIGPP